jgi:hypothetical protein
LLSRRRNVARDNRPTADSAALFDNLSLELNLLRGDVKKRFLKVEPKMEAKKG